MQGLIFRSWRVKLSQRKIRILDLTFFMYFLLFHYLINFIFSYFNHLPKIPTFVIIKNALRTRAHTTY